MRQPDQIVVPATCRGVSLSTPAVVVALVGCVARTRRSQRSGDSLSRARATALALERARRLGSRGTSSEHVLGTTRSLSIALRLYGEKSLVEDMKERDASGEK